MPPIELQINGQPYSLEADAQMPLLWALRDLLGLTGTNTVAVRVCVEPAPFWLMASQLVRVSPRFPPWPGKLS